MTYQVVDWDKWYENSKSRERKACSFVCLPNKQHGLGFARIMSEPDGMEIYGIWVCILCACSQQAAPRAGFLTLDGHRAGTAWAPEDLALKFHRAGFADKIARALEVLSSEKVGWLRIVQSARLVPAKCPPATRDVPDQCPVSALEEKRREEKRSTHTHSAGARPFQASDEAERPSATNRQNFPEVAIPGWPEVQAQAAFIGLAEWRARIWFDEMQASGWILKNQLPVRDWKPLLTTIKTWWQSDGSPAQPPTRGKKYDNHSSNSGAKRTDGNQGTANDRPEVTDQYKNHPGLVRLSESRKPSAGGDGK